MKWTATQISAKCETTPRTHNSAKPQVSTAHALAAWPDKIHMMVPLHFQLH